MTALVAIGAGGLGAVARYLASGWVQRRTGALVPTGTAAVNLLGAGALGLAAGALDGASLAFVAVAGFLGGFTTFSTWTVETVLLARRGKGGRLALANLVVLTVAGVGAAAAGHQLGALWGS